MNNPKLAGWQQLQVNLADYARGRIDALPVESDKAPQQRLDVYRRLVQSNIEGVVAKVFPLTAARLGTERWDAWVSAFIAEAELTSPYFNAISEQFLIFVQTQANESSNKQLALAPVELELLHYEWLELYVAQQAAVTPLTTAAPPVLLPTTNLVVAQGVSLVHYQYPVHEVNADWDDEPSLTYLALYRSPTTIASQEQVGPESVSFLRLQPLTFYLLSQLTDGMTLAHLIECLEVYMESHAAPPNWKNLLEHTLAEFIRLGVVEIA